MSKRVKSVCHGLEMTATDGLYHFAGVGNMVRMTAVDLPEPSGEIPGSLRVAVSSENSMVSKKITWLCEDISQNGIGKLERLKIFPLIATYTDAQGRRRVAGSPDYPLTLDYLIGDGVAEVTLQGVGLENDPEVEMV